jgi:hypothetical protein
VTEEQTPIKIVIPVEDETPLVPESDRVDIRANIRQVGQRVTSTSGNMAKRAWRSTVRKNATGTIRRGLKKTTATGGRVIHNTVVKSTERQLRKRANATRSRIEATDWKREAKMGTGKGLRWLSQRLARLADRLTLAASPESEAEDLPE